MTWQERFWSKVDKRGADECWPWTAGCFAAGYGQSMTAGSLFAGIGGFDLALEREGFNVWIVRRMRAVQARERAASMPKSRKRSSRAI